MAVSIGVSMNDYRADTSLVDVSKYAPSPSSTSSSAASSPSANDPGAAQGFAANMLSSLPGLAQGWQSVAM
jgi:hypothetical protein